MNIFIDEFGTIFAEFKEGIFNPISKEEYERLEKNGQILNIEFAIGELNEK